MSYAEENLIDGEEIVFRTRDHWSVYLSLRSILSLGIVPWIERKTNEYVLTNKRIIIKKGLIARTTFEMSIGKVESINIVQGILDRMLGSGSIVINGSGGSHGTFSQVEQPLLLRRKFMELQTA